MSAVRFTSLDVRKVDDDSGRNWLLLSPFIVLVVIDSVEYLIRVPDGFITDFASVPRIPLAFMLFGGIGDYGACVHDYLYRNGLFTREICDAIYKEILLHVDKTSEFRALAMHRGVRLGGASSYKGVTV